MKTQPYIDLNDSLDDQKQYDNLTMHFIMAIYSKDVNMLKNLLYPSGTFLNGLNMWQTLKWFSEQFNTTIPQEYLTAEIQERISMDTNLPGRSLVFFKGYFPFNKNNPARPKAICLRFTNDKISGINLCYNTISEEDASKLVKMN